MGLVKRLQMDEEERGWHSVPDKFVCKDCLNDSYLKDAVEENAESPRCDYCDNVTLGGTPIAARIDVVTDHVASALRFEYTDPANELPYCSREGGFQGVVHSTDDLVADLEISDQEGLVEDVCCSIDQTDWCDRNYFCLPTDRLLIQSWHDFCETVKHRLRYLFLLDFNRADVASDRLGPGGTLLAITQALERAELYRPLEAGSYIYRARCHREERALDDLGPPRAHQAKTSNRLSPVGIPIFYGALDEDTACAEAAASNRDRSYVTVGRYCLATDLTVIDLASELVLPSIFDEEQRDLRPTVRFLTDFAKDVSKPITKDGREHINYVPTQIVSEYMRHYVGRPPWVSEMLGPESTASKNRFTQAYRKVTQEVLQQRRVDGILYRSAVQGGGTCCGLYVAAEACGNSAGKGTTLVVDADARKTKRLN